MATQTMCSMTVDILKEVMAEMVVHNTSDTTYRDSRESG